MVYQVVDVAGLELVQDGNGDRSVGYRSQETHSPVRLVPGADGHFVSLVQTALFEGDMQFLDTSCDVTVF